MRPTSVPSVPGDRIPLVLHGSLLPALRTWILYLNGSNPVLVSEAEGMSEDRNPDL